MPQRGRSQAEAVQIRGLRLNRKELRRRRQGQKSVEKVCFFIVGFCGLFMAKLSINLRKSTLRFLSIMCTKLLKGNLCSNYAAAV